MSEFVSATRDEQGLWRAVHEVGSAAGLEAEDLSKLRGWAADRARKLPAVVFDKHELGGPVRPSFRTALAHAARELSDGRTPD